MVMPLFHAARAAASLRYTPRQLIDYHFAKHDTVTGVLPSITIAIV